MQESQGKVLIIDDHAELSFGLSVLLGSVGFDVDTAGSGEEGLDRLRSTHYDVVVVDFRLPGMSGRDFIESVRQSPHTQQLPVIALTASVMKLEECMQAGATRGLNKPCKFDRLIHELRSTMAEVDEVDDRKATASDSSGSAETTTNPHLEAHIDNVQSSIGHA